MVYIYIYIFQNIRFFLMFLIEKCIIWNNAFIILCFLNIGIIVILLKLNANYFKSYKNILNIYIIIGIYSENY